MYDEQKYRHKITSIIESRGLYSAMNNTKWGELKAGIQSLPFAPPFVMKRIDEEETEYHKFNEDVWYLGDWGHGLDGFLGSDIFATPFFAIEWVKIRPRYLKPQGRLVSDKIFDETEEFVKLLKCNYIPYEEQQGSFIIYGYR